MSFWEEIGQWAIFQLIKVKDYIPVLPSLRDIVIEMAKILQEIMALPLEVLKTFIIWLMLILYPIELIIMSSYSLASYLWFILIGAINLVISIPALGLQVWNLFFSGTMLPIWGSLVFLAILINVSIRVFAFGVWMYKKIPIFGGH